MLNIKNLPVHLGLAASLVLFIGCHSDNGSDKSVQATPDTPNAKGRISLTLANAGFGGNVHSLTLQVLQVQVQRGDDTWVDVPLGIRKKALGVDLMNPGDKPLIEGAILPVGSYKALRVAVGRVNRASLGDPKGETPKAEEIVIPDNRLLVGADLRVVAGGETRYAFLYDVSQGVDRASNGKLVFRPGSPQARDLDQVGTLTGKLTDRANHNPLGGVRVTAQGVSPSGTPLDQSLPPSKDRYQVVRTAVTAKDGSFSLDYLPLDRDFRVVSLARSDHRSYDVAVSPVVHLGKGGPTTLERNLSAPSLPASTGKVVLRGFPDFKADWMSHRAILLRNVVPEGEKDPVTVTAGYARMHQNGDHVFDAVAPGTYALWFFSDNGDPRDEHASASAEHPNIIVKSGADAEVVKK